MFKSQETQEKLLLILLISISVGTIIGGFWWASRESIHTIVNRSSQLSNNSTNRISKKIHNFAQVQNVPSGIFNYGGSTTWAPIRKSVDPLIQATWLRYKLRYTSPVAGNPGSGNGIRMLLEGQLSFAQSSRPLKQKEYEQARKRGYSLKQVPVAIDGIAVGVNPNLRVSGLTITQIGDIYAGKIVNWKQLGGQNMPINPYSRHEHEGGTVAFFVDNILGDRKLGKNVEFVKNTTEGIRKVSSNLGGIYFATIAEIISQCRIKPVAIGQREHELVTPYQQPYVPPSKCPQKRNQIDKHALQNGTYPITRRLFIIVKQDGLEDEIAGNAYIKLLVSDQGQELIDRAEFVRIR